jgi:hypothetical protein
MFVVVAAMLGSAPNALAAGGEPAISSASATNITETGATLEAQINPEGTATSYAFWIECQNPPPDSATCEAVALTSHGQGNLAAGSEKELVSASVSGLQPGTAYWYVVVATSSGGKAESRRRPLETQLLGACDHGCPYKTEVSEQAEELGRLSAEEAPAKEAARQKAAKEQVEREAALAKANQQSSVVPTTTRGSPTIATGSVSLASTNITVLAGFVSLVKLECRGSASCRGKITLSAEIARATGKKKRARKVDIGTVSFLIWGDEAKTVKIKLDSSGRALLGLDHGHCSASLVLLELVPSPENTQTKTVRLVQQKAAKGKKS